MINKRGNDFIFNQKGFPLGIISDGDSLDRPDGSLADLVNFDYDVESGELRTRNSTSNSDILNGFTLPTGYLLMAGGVKLFSFNNPVDREVRLVFVKNTIAPFDVRIFVNTWFNPPAPNTDPDTGSNDYENYISSKADGWNDEWIEITEYMSLKTFVITSPTTFTVDSAGLSTGINNYRGWFVWNSTKWNSGATDQIKNESFVCIESYDGAGGFTIQNRTNLSLTNLAWANGNSVFLMRYPVVVHKALDTALGSENLRMVFTPSEANWIVKTNTNIKILTGEEGGLWFGFVNKDITKYAGPTGLYNQHKYYGWWFDFETYPVTPPVDKLVVNTNFYTSPVTGIRFRLASGSANDITLFALSIYVDFTQRMGVYKLFNSTKTNPESADNILFYHQYSRRISGIRTYTKDNATMDTDDPTENTLANLETPYFNSSVGRYIYSPLYSLFTGIVTTLSLTLRGVNTLAGLIMYSVTEQIFTKATFGQFAQGRMFVSGDDDFPDTVRYSLFQREDIFALQNQKPIDATDRDKNTAIDLLGINPVVFKNRSIHIANIEGETEVGWRLIETKSRVGCPYPRSIARTNYGLTFSNDEGYWLLQDAGEPANLFKGRRLQAYLALTNKSQIFAEWYGKHSEVWIYVGNKTFWVCKLNKEERIIGFKTYSFNFTPIDIFTDDNGDLFIQGTNFIYKYNNDDEVTDGEDADGSGIAWSFTPNYNTFDRYSPFHHIETIISFKGTNKDGLIPNGNYQSINISIYKENDEVIQTKSKTYNVSSSSPLSLVVKNDTANRQRALKIKVYGTLTNLKRLEFTEINSRCKAVVTQTKSAYKEIA